MTAPMIDAPGAPAPGGSSAGTSSKAPPGADQRTSEILRALVADAEGATVTVGALLQQLRLRAYGYALLIFGLPSCLPMPPGVPTICGILLAIVSVQMMVGGGPLWLPDILEKREIETKTLTSVVDRMQPWVERVERLMRPRLSVMTGPVGYRLVGLVVFLLGVIMTLPIPFLGNMPPAFATVIIAVGLTERDGLVVLAGLVVSAVALALSATLAVEAAMWLVNAVTGLWAG